MVIEKPPIETWMEDNLPPGSFYRMGELPPELVAELAALIGANLHTMPQALKEDFASFLVAQLEADPSPENRQSTADLLQRLELRGH